MFVCILFSVLLENISFNIEMSPLPVKGGQNLGLF